MITEKHEMLNVKNTSLEPTKIRVAGNYLTQNHFCVYLWVIILLESHSTAKSQP